MKHHQPNPSGRPLPSASARVFYSPFWFKEQDGEVIRMRHHQTGEKLLDFYGQVYSVQPDASIKRVS